MKMGAKKIIKKRIMFYLQRKTDTTETTKKLRVDHNNKETRLENSGAGNSSRTRENRRQRTEVDSF